jgi:hypothetical protein
MIKDYYMGYALLYSLLHAAAAALLQNHISG